MAPSALKMISIRALWLHLKNYTKEIFIQSFPIHVREPNFSSPFLIDSICLKKQTTAETVKFWIQISQAFSDWFMQTAEKYKWVLKRVCWTPNKHYSKVKYLRFLISEHIFP